MTELHQSLGAQHIDGNGQLQFLVKFDGCCRMEDHADRATQQILQVNRIVSRYSFRIPHRPHARIITWSFSDMPRSSDVMSPQIGMTLLSSDGLSLLIVSNNCT